MIEKRKKVYTKTGDHGFTSIIGEKGVSKADVRLEAYGTVDELDAHLGLLVTYLDDTADHDFVVSIQRKLFVLCAELATTKSKKNDLKEKISGDDVNLLEHEIDRLDDFLPRLLAFVVPGGSRGAAVAHICRTVCRRAERRIIRLSENEEVSSTLLSYVNRLSDYLFVLSRKINFFKHFEENS